MHTKKSSCEHTVRQVADYKPRKQASEYNLPCWHLILNLPAFRTINHFCCLSHSVYDILLQQPELRHIPPLFCFLSPPLLSGTARCSMLILYTACSNSRISHFPKDPSSFYWRTVLENKNWALGSTIFLYGQIILCLPRARCDASFFLCQFT